MIKIVEAARESTVGDKKKRMNLSELESLCVDLKAHVRQFRV